MPAQTPTGTCECSLDQLGKVKGWIFENGVRQFCGIPYATLSKRWTRSEMRISWADGYHDGTKLGPSCPHPGLLESIDDILTPVPQFPHFDIPIVDELNGLVMNIAIPPAASLLAGQTAFPICVYVHGGSLMFGGANLAIFDAVNLVSISMSIKKPIIVINFNYRIGIGGFLAGHAVQKELARDGYQGSGNFGFTDQQVALEWVKRYGKQLGGDINSITVCGESAGGISISNQLCANTPPLFHRAICMSGLSSSIPAWTLDKHDDYFSAICKHFHIDPHSESALSNLRQIPEMELADATPAIIGVGGGTGNPCLDDWFYDSNCDPRNLNPAPAQLKSFMFGDTFHEGMIFHLNLLDDTYGFWLQLFNKHLNDQSLVTQIFQMYDIRPELSQSELILHFEEMAGDAIFKIPNYVLARQNPRLHKAGKLFLYHFDQRSRLKNELEGMAYHAHDLLFLFNNLREQFKEEEVKMARDFATGWIDFTYGLDPWSPSSGQSGGEKYVWKVWGQLCAQRTVAEKEDEEVRQYARMDKMLELGEPGVTWKKWFLAVDEVVNKRMRLGIGAAATNGII